MGAMIIAEIGDFNRFDSLDKIWHMPDFHLLLINLVNSDGAYSHMENEAPDICGMRYTMRPNMSAIGIRRLLNIWQRNEPKASITTLLYLMLSKSWFESFIILKTNQQYIKAD